MTYHVRQPFLGVRDGQASPFFITITEASIITVKGKVLESGLVDVLHDGQIIAAFKRDIEARAELVEATVAS